MTAHEHEDQRVVGAGGGRIVAGERPRRREVFPSTTSLLGAVLVGHPARRHAHQPAKRILRHAVARPLLGCGDECFLGGVFGVGEVAVPPHDRTEDPRRQLAQQALGGRGVGHSTPGSGGLMICRTSMA